MLTEAQAEAQEDWSKSWPHAQAEWLVLLCIQGHVRELPLTSASFMYPKEKVCMEQTLDILEVLPKAKVRNGKSLPAINTASEKRRVSGVSYAARPTDVLCTFHMGVWAFKCLSGGRFWKANVSPACSGISECTPCSLSRCARAKVESNPAVCLQYSLSGKEMFVIALFIGHQDDYYALIKDSPPSLRIKKDGRVSNWVQTLCSLHVPRMSFVCTEVLPAAPVQQPQQQCCSMPRRKAHFQRKLPSGINPTLFRGFLWFLAAVLTLEIKSVNEWNVMRRTSITQLYWTMGCFPSIAKLFKMWGNGAEG